MPADVGPFRRFFRIPLRFDAENYGLLFPVRDLSHRLIGIDDELRVLLQAQIGVLEQRHGNDLPAQVRSVLGTSILAGRCKAEHVAALFGMHSRTLNRRLSTFDVSLQQLVDESRFEIARQMLEYSATEIGQISDLLGYAAPGVFTRAFRRWSGTTPLHWREERRGGA
jgi:AraC-like DNA-binding protein